MMVVRQPATERGGVSVQPNTHTRLYASACSSWAAVAPRKSTQADEGALRLLTATTGMPHPYPLSTGAPGHPLGGRSDCKAQGTAGFRAVGERMRG